MPERSTPWDDLEVPKRFALLSLGVSPEDWNSYTISGVEELSFDDIVEATEVPPADEFSALAVAPGNRFVSAEDGLELLGWTYGKQAVQCHFGFADA